MYACVVCFILCACEDTTHLKFRGVVLWCNVFVSGSFGGDQSSDTSSERSFLFVEIVRTHDRKLGLIDLSRFWNIGIFDKILNFGGYVLRNESVFSQRSPSLTVFEWYREKIVFQGARIFSKFDLKAGFWQLGISPVDYHKTAFCIPDASG